MAEFTVGHRVHVEFDGEITYENSDGTFDVRLFHDSCEVIDYVPVSALKPGNPKDWPPQLGDIWEAAGTEYFVYDGITGPDIVFPFTSGLTKQSYMEDELDDFKGLSPRLVRRRGQ